MSPRRRTMVLATALITAVLLITTQWPIAAVQAAPAPASKTDAGPTHSRAVKKRLTLWATPADSSGLSARYQLTRSSSMLYEPLKVTGNLTLTAPDRLELRDDELGGATTQLAGEALTMVANDPTLPPSPNPNTRGGPGRRWLRERLFALLLARDAEALLADTVVTVARGAAMQLELTPARNHPARHEVLRLRIQLDPTTGEVLEVVLNEAGGDVVTLTLSGHQRSG
ncbi:MAG: outer membrane lipoprotein carrier protein LolA [Nannocystis sp.]|nr:outer membrane lipoprotein carrier protein LolA [Nannocystis sp.]MBA3547207.1 outer membrane lipoprotein carrier protein LolA [Nannocystis sp.]